MPFSGYKSNAAAKYQSISLKNHSLRMTEKVDPKEYQAAWESVLDCVEGMKEEFSWSKDVNIVN